MKLHPLTDKEEIQRRLCRLRDERQPLKPSTLILLGEKYTRYGRRIERERKMVSA